MKQTAKYKAATILSQKLSLPQTEDSRDLYRLLNDNGWYWDEQSGWIEKLQPPHPPSKLVRVRVWASCDRLEAEAKAIADALIEIHDYELVEKSDPYPCRPPSQQDSRVYLTFLPPKNNAN